MHSKNIGKKCHILQQGGTPLQMKIYFDFSGKHATWLLFSDCAGIISHTQSYYTVGNSHFKNIQLIMLYGSTIVLYFRFCNLKGHICVPS